VIGLASKVSLIMQFLLSGTVALEGMRQFDCSDYEWDLGDGLIFKKRYWKPDFTEDCDAEESKGRQTFGIVGLGVCCVIIPFIYFGLLFSESQRNLGQEGQQFAAIWTRKSCDIYYFLFKGYKKKFWFWDFCVKMRLNLVAIGWIFLANGKQQIVVELGLLVTVASLVIHTYMMPYLNQMHNYLESISLIVTIISFGEAFPTTKPDEPNSISVMTLISLHCIFFACFLATLVKDGLVFRENKKREDFEKEQEKGLELSKKEKKWLLGDEDRWDVFEELYSKAVRQSIPISSTFVYSLLVAGLIVTLPVLQ